MESHIDLSLPARTDYLYLVRLNVSAVASRIDMTLETAEDLQLAAEELCTSLLSGSRRVPERLELHLGWGDGEVEITCRLTGALDTDESGSWTNEGFPEAISRRILDALVDEHGRDVDGESPTAWLRKRVERPLPGA